MKSLLTRALNAARTLYLREPAAINSAVAGAVVFAALKLGVVVDKHSVAQAIAVALPVLLLSGGATRALVTPAAALTASPTGWLPTGALRSWGLTLSRHQLEDAGTFTSGGRKIVWHTTEGGSVDSVVQTLTAKRAAVHFVIDPHTGRVVQCIPLNCAGRGLEHNGGPETNRANCIQIEIVGFAAESGTWGDREYRHLAALACLINHHFGIRAQVRSFAKPTRFVGNGFVEFAGHCGHCHVPGNTHVDPGTGFNAHKMLGLMKELDH